jgi:hypothetical protein
MSNALPTNHLLLVPFQSHVSSHSNQFLDQLRYLLLKAKDLVKNINALAFKNLKMQLSKF